MLSFFRSMRKSYNECVLTNMYDVNIICMMLILLMSRYLKNKAGIQTTEGDILHVHITIIQNYKLSLFEPNILPGYIFAIDFPARSACI